jgi:hypothetical protein
VTRLASIKRRATLGWCLAIMVMAGRLPLSAGLAISASRGHAELSVDICHPIQPAGTAQAVLLAIPVVHDLRFALCDLGVLPLVISLKIESLYSPPESPPPEASV